ncbi:hypothetical protein ACFLVX_03705, partial [Chloroflexota bacterium]
LKCSLSLSVMNISHPNIEFSLLSVFSEFIGYPESCADVADDIPKSKRAPATAQLLSGSSALLSSLQSPKPDTTIILF